MGDSMRQACHGAQVGLRRAAALSDGKLQGGSGRVLAGGRAEGWQEAGLKTQDTDTVDRRQRRLAG